MTDAAPTARSTARGVAWMTATSMGARIVGLLGTIAMTRFLAPEVVGEVATASIITLTAGWLSTWGFGQYAVVYGRGDAALEITWHATVAYAVVGVVGLGGVALAAPWLAGLLDASGAAHYVPGLAAAAVIRRIGATPERVLTRGLRFRAVGLAAAAGEVTYSIVALACAARGWGGDAVVAGNVAQSTMATALLVRAAGWRAWATPARLRWSRFAHMMRFGVPLAVQGIAHSASRYWGTLLVTRLFGAGATGVYNLAYNLADVPAIYVGEQLALVLMPSLAGLPPERRARALERSAALLSLIIFPLAIGLGLVAQPLVATALSGAWQGVATLLTVLAALSVFRPITWVLSAYLESFGRTGRLMLLEIANLAVMLGAMWLLSPLGLAWSAAAIGASFGLYAVAGVWVATRDGGPSVRRLAL
ncbi:MAG: oligosaccharide flippase family protein, partial [Deltaproteobacteria bacterium]|nr:oligosaccharide flippase family protein [Deltaproteobacteria bacterium]